MGPRKSLLFASGKRHYERAMGKRAAGFLKNAFLVLASVLFSLAVIEGALEWLMNRPGLLQAEDGTPTNPLRVLRAYYDRNDRAIVQYLPGCARYDAEVTYTLKPGACTVTNREHAVRYEINRMGLRDSDAALDRPDAIVLGDSMAMGWGVGQEESLAPRLARALGLKVLNAAISSFATAREMILLERLAREVGDNYRIVLIQYHANDLGENRTYLEGGGRLPIMPEAAYRTVFDFHPPAIRYWPGKHLRHVVDLAWVSLRRADRPRPDSSAEEARAFLDVLRLHRDRLAGKTVIVFELTGWNRVNSRFVERARALLAEDRYRDLAPVLSFVDLSTVLKPRDFFILDEHLNAAGHARVADALAAEIRRREGR